MRKITPKKTKDMIGPSKMDEKPSYPSFRMELEHLPEAKEYNVGDTCMIKMMAKIVGKSQSRFQNDVEFEVHGIEMKKEKSNPDMEDSEDMSEEDED